jgi:uncharacterized protein YgiB involved in biofilm formation
MQGRPRKRSAHVTLILLGAAAALTGCSDEDTDRRDVYRNQADCVQDWGDEKKCEPVRDGSYHSSYWYGPMYHPGSYGRTGNTSVASSSVARSGSHAVATHSVSRGGFGGSASAHSSHSSGG